MIDFSRLQDLDFYLRNQPKEFGDIDSIITVYFLTSALVTSIFYFLSDIKKQKYYYKFVMEQISWLLAFLVVVNLFGMFLQLAMFEQVVEFGLSMRVWIIATVLIQISLNVYLLLFKIPGARKDFPKNK
jgi:uncharacterized membrane protein